LFSQILAEKKQILAEKNERKLNNRYRVSLPFKGRAGEGSVT
jgi:hypothetical protein